jgi:hypothetical protein
MGNIDGLLISPTSHQFFNNWSYLDRS